MLSFKANILMPYIQITQGITKRENYFIPLYENNIYDLRFQYPINFFSGQEANKGIESINFREKEFKAYFDRY